MNRKKIYFCVDIVSFLRLKSQLNTIGVTRNYDSTQGLLKLDLDEIITTSLAHLSFDLLDLGYDIYLCYKGKNVKIEPGMQLHIDGSPCKEIKRGHDIFKMFRAGVFNEILGIKKNE